MDVIIFDAPLRLADMVSLAGAASPLANLGDRCGTVGAHADALLATVHAQHAPRSTERIPPSWFRVLPRGDLAERQVTPSPDYIRTSVTTPQSIAQPAVAYAHLPSRLGAVPTCA